MDIIETKIIFQGHTVGKKETAYRTCKGCIYSTGLHCNNVTGIKCMKDGKEFIFILTGELRK